MARDASLVAERTFQFAEKCAHATCYRLSFGLCCREHSAGFCLDSFQHAWGLLSRLVRTSCAHRSPTCRASSTSAKYLFCIACVRGSFSCPGCLSHCSGGGLQPPNRHCKLFGSSTITCNQLFLFSSSSYKGPRLSASSTVAWSCQPSILGGGVGSVGGPFGFVFIRFSLFGTWVDKSLQRGNSRAGLRKMSHSFPDN